MPRHKLMQLPFAPPYYAVIFTSTRADDLTGYDSMAKKMQALCETQPGFLKMVHATTDAGESVTTCYWKDRQSIANWKDNLEHQAAQQLGKEKWYAAYQIEVVRVEHAYRWARDA